jgi:hypothetical protein
MTSIDTCKPFHVVMKCGHTEIRMMRAATAGIPWTPAATIVAPTASCTFCEQSKTPSDVQRTWAIGRIEALVPRDMGPEWDARYRVPRAGQDEYPLSSELTSREIGTLLPKSEVIPTASGRAS